MINIAYDKIKLAVEILVDINFYNDCNADFTSGSYIKIFLQIKNPNKPDDKNHGVNIN